MIRDEYFRVNCFRKQKNCRVESGMGCRGKKIKMTQMNLIRKHITFYGWAQGVGFRWRARHAADLYGCTGWVHNDYDGSVTMEIQGTEKAIDSVILAIESGHYIKIENMAVRSLAPIEGEYGFRVR